MAQLRFWDYIKAAFNAKPKGLFLSPNWVGLAVFGMLGFLNSGLWIIGAGLELGYLLACASNVRFRKVVAAQAGHAAATGHRGEISRLLASLSVNHQQRYQRLLVKCKDILQASRSEDAESASSQAQGLAHLAWIFLNLLSARDVIQKHLGILQAEEAAEGSLEQRLAAVEKELASAEGSDDLRHSLSSRKQILDERLASRRESLDKLEFTTAELIRIEEQVQLMRDQAAIQEDPAALSASLDRVTGDFQAATSWIREQRQVYRDLGGVLDEPPPASILASD